MTHIETGGMQGLFQKVEASFFPKQPTPEKLRQLAQRISALEEPASSINCKLSRVIIGADGRYGFVVPVVNHRGALTRDNTVYTCALDSVIKKVTKDSKTTSSKVTSARELIGLQNQMEAVEQRYIELRDTRLAHMR